MSIDTSEIRIRPTWVANFGDKNTMTDGPKWVDPTSVLIAADKAETGQVLPLVWGLKASIETNAISSFFNQFTEDSEGSAWNAET